jgi:hypothetical protein
MVLRLGEHNALARNNLGASWIAECLRLIHCGDQEFADVANDEPTGHLDVANAQFFHQGLHDFDMPVGLLKILGPLVLQILIPGAGQRGFIDFNAAKSLASAEVVH